MLLSASDLQGVRTEVEVTLTSGKVLYGEMFLRSEQTLFDILSSDTQFLPFEGMDGAMSINNKATIAKISQHDYPVAERGHVIAFGD